MSLKCLDDCEIPWGVHDPAFSPALFPCSPNSALSAHKDARHHRFGALPDRVDVPDQQCPSLRDEEMGVSKGIRCFPPPIDSCATLSIKKGGRFVLKEVNARPHGFFRAQREKGRLLLQLVRPLQVEEEEDGEPDPDDECLHLTRHETGNGEENEDPSGLERVEIATDVSQKLEELSSATETTDPSEIEEDYRPSQIIDNEEEEQPASTEHDNTFVHSENENTLVNCGVERIMQVDDDTGFGGQAAMQMQQQSLWKTSEASLNLWTPPTRVFMHPSLSRVSRVMGLAIS